MANLTIDLYANDGSPLKITPPVIYGRGVGGAELSMITWAETMTNRGHHVRIYNNPDSPGEYDGVEYLLQDAFESERYRDIFIAYRSPPLNQNIQAIEAGLKIHWSTDQYTAGDYAADLVPYVDKIICISPYHMMDYQSRYNPSPDQITYIDLGVRLQDYPLEMKKIQNRFIFCSVPERGLEIARYIWPHIKEALPDATLVITADHRLWGSHSPNNHTYRLNMLNLDGIVFLGAIPRHEMTKHQVQAQIHLYPCIYEELFCISSAECQTVGAYSVTSNVGALETTNEFGLILDGDPRDPAWQKKYVQVVIDLMIDQKSLTNKALEGAKLARERFSWEKICDKWEAVIWDNIDLEEEKGELETSQYLDG